VRLHSCDKVAGVDAVIRLSKLLIVGLVLIIFLWILLISSNLRPIADDYCHGSVATSGFLGAISTWLLTWTGSLLPVITSVLFVGLPLAFIPIGMSSAVGYLISALSVGVMAVLAFQPGWKRHFLRNVVMVIVVTTFWLLHLRIVQVVGTRPGENPGEDPDQLLTYQLAEMLTHWQTVTVAYVLTPAIALAVIGYGLLGSFSRNWVRLARVFVGTILAGQAGYVLGVALALVFGILVFLDWALGKRQSFGIWIVGVLGAFVGLLTTFLFPGAYARVGATDSGTLERLPLAIRAMPHGISQWFEELVSLSSVVVLLMGVLLYVLFSSSLKLVPAENWTGFVPRFLLGASAIFYVVNEAAQALVYAAAWHIVPARLMTFVALIFLGVGMARFLEGVLPKRVRNPRYQVAALVPFFAVVAWILIVATAVLTASINERAEAWNEGPAPFEFISDRDTLWVERCWVELENSFTGRF